MTRSTARFAAWPLLVVAACLFLLSLLAPWNWQSASVGSRTTAGHGHEPFRPDQSSPDAANSVEDSVAATVERQADAEATRRQSADLSAISRLPPLNREIAPAAPAGPARVDMLADPDSPTAGFPQPDAIANGLGERAFVAATEAVPSAVTPPHSTGLAPPDPTAIQQRDLPPARIPSQVRELPETPSSRIEPPNSHTNVAAHAFWPAPTSLLKELDEFAQKGTGVEWVLTVKGTLDRLGSATAWSDPVVAKSLEQLQQLVDAANAQAASLPDLAQRGEWMRVTYALTRRLAVWNSMRELSTVTGFANLPTHRTTLSGAYADVMHVLRTRDPNGGWRTFLLMDEASQLTSSTEPPTAEQRALARRLLNRMDSPSLNDAQVGFLQSPEFGRWREALSGFAHETVNPAEVVARVEAYEANLSAAAAHDLARVQDVLHWSPIEGERTYAQALNEHYRNANVRVAISAALINRLLPDSHTSVDAVNDVIRDARVHGRSQTQTRMRVVLVPDRRKWQMGLEARGEVASSTESSKGPATFFQDAWSQFNAKKQVTVDHRGVRTDRAEVRARSNSNLRGFETDYDGIPLFNLLARSIARQQYHDESTAARAEVESKVAQLAGSKLDEEVQRRLQDAEGEFQSRWLKPLHRLGLEPTAIDMETTQERLIVRYRLASSQQLAAHTPRPQALANSWLSVQIHESAVNNSLAQLGLEGRRITLTDLYRELAAKFDRPVPTLPDDLPEDVSLKLADEEGVRIRCDHGKVILTMRVAELAQGKQKWKNFVVRATYVPVADQRDANLVRDGIIELGGEPRGLGNQLALRGIFAKVLSHNRPIRLVNESLAKKPELSDLEVNQFVVSDGWIGLALAPKSTAPAASTPKTADLPHHAGRRTLRR